MKNSDWKSLYELMIQRDRWQRLVTDSLSLFRSENLSMLESIGFLYDILERVKNNIRNID